MTYFFNPELDTINLDPEVELSDKVHANILLGSKKFFSMLEKNTPIKDDEEILGVNITDSAINVIFRKKINLDKKV